jgi:hypothetical protein
LCGVSVPTNVCWSSSSLGRSDGDGIVLSPPEGSP